MDEVFNSRAVYQDHEDVLYHELTQPTENTILERNKELRKDPGVIKDLGANMGSGETWGRQVASIPFIIYNHALRLGYELDAPGEQGQREMARFLQTDLGKQCLVR